jgi:ribosomal silencing factor RsfS
MRSGKITWGGALFLCSLLCSCSAQTERRVKFITHELGCTYCLASEAVRADIRKTYFQEPETERAWIVIDCGAILCR